MKKIILYAICISLLFIIGCGTTVPHPVTGVPIMMPREFVGKVSFEITLKYIYKGNDKDISSLLVETIQGSGFTLEITSLTPLICKSTNDMQLGDLNLTGYFPTYVRLNFYLLRQNELNVGIVPTFGGYSEGTVNEWILNEHLDILKSRLDSILNPIGFERS